MVAETDVTVSVVVVPVVAELVVGGECATDMFVLRRCRGMAFRRLTVQYCLWAISLVLESATRLQT